MRLFPNLPTWPKRKRRVAMCFVWPLVFVEGLVNYVIGFPVDFYNCWNAERIRGEQ